MLLEIVELAILENGEGIFAVEIEVGVLVGERRAEVMQQRGRQRNRLGIGLVVERRLEVAVATTFFTTFSV